MMEVHVPGPEDVGLAAGLYCEMLLLVDASVPPLPLTLLSLLLHRHPVGR